MLLKLIIAALGCVVGTCAFLARHLLKQILIDPSADPVVRLQSKKKQIRLKASAISDIDAEINRKVAEAIKNEPTMQTFPDNAAYLNPLLAIDHFAQQAKQQQNHNNLYVSAKQRFYERTFRSEMMDSIMLPIKLQIYNRGDKATSQMKITLNIQANGLPIYPAAAKQSLQDFYYNSPTGRPTTTNIYLTLKQTLGSTDYQYNVWDLSKSLPSSLTIETKSLLPGDTDKTSLPIFYIDTRQSGTITIKWHIAENDLGEKGNSGEIIVEIV